MKLNEASCQTIKPNTNVNAGKISYLIDEDNINSVSSFEVLPSKRKKGKKVVIASEAVSQ